MSALTEVFTALLAMLVLWREMILPVIPWIAVLVGAAVVFQYAREDVRADQAEMRERVMRERRNRLLEEKLARPTTEESLKKGLIEDELAALAVIRARAEDVARVCEGVKIGAGSSAFVVREMGEIVNAAKRIQEKLNRLMEEK